MTSHDPYGYAAHRARIASLFGWTEAYTAAEYPDSVLHEEAKKHEDAASSLRLCADGRGNLYVFSHAFRGLSHEEILDCMKIKAEPYVWGVLDLFRTCATCGEGTHTTVEERELVHKAMAEVYFYTHEPPSLSDQRQGEFGRKYEATLADVERVEELMASIGTINRDRCAGRRAVTDALADLFNPERAQTEATR